MASQDEREARRAAYAALNARSVALVQEVSAAARRPNVSAPAATPEKPRT